MLFDSTYATLLSVFDTVDFYPSGGNSIAIAYDGPRRSDEELMEMARQRQAQYGFRYDLPELVASRRSHELPGEEIEVLTDDFAPVNLLQAIEVHNRKWE
jgi:spermidine synthase